MRPIREKELHQYIDECISRESPPRVSELAERLGLSRVTLNKQIKENLGVVASQYLKALQLERAKSFLAATSLSTTRVAYVLAFGTRRTFYRRFFAAYGMTPQQFRRWRWQTASTTDETYE